MPYLSHSSHPFFKEIVTEITKTTVKLWFFMKKVYYFKKIKIKNKKNK